MKKSILAFAFLVAVFTPLAAQTAVADTSVYWMYAELLGTHKILSTKVNVSVDYGQSRKWFSNNFITDSEGKIESFNSMVDAMNYMGERDWEFVQAYVVTVGNQNVYHWLLKRACRKNDAGDFIPLTRAEWKAKQAKN